MSRELLGVEHRDQRPSCHPDHRDHDEDYDSPEVFSVCHGDGGFSASATGLDHAVRVSHWAGSSKSVARGALVLIKGVAGMAVMGALIIQMNNTALQRIERRIRQLRVIAETP
jgi:hypothetical protein